mgnify:CR=1 FL=1
MDDAKHLALIFASSLNEDQLNKFNLVAESNPGLTLGDVYT